MAEEPKVTRIVIEWDNGGHKQIVEGEELEFWITAMLLKSDYLFPQTPHDVLGSGMSGLVRGWFTPPINTPTNPVA